jgi:hypothetical protein
METRPSFLTNRNIRYCDKLESEILTVVVTDAAIFGDMSPCSPYMNRNFGESIPSIFKVENQPRKKPAGTRCLLASFSADFEP